MMEDVKVPLYQLKLFIRDPEKLVFRGLVDSVTAISDKGAFDILPIHENLISIIKEKVIIRVKDKSQEFMLKTGILKVEENVVHVFLSTGTGE